jgi:alpha-beta hydrolase superfamily lysophospholipase
LFGHSMGSMAALQYVQSFHDPLAGLMLSGTPGVAAAFQTFVSHTVARFERGRRGEDGESELMQRMLFADANKEFEGKTGFEWLSRDPVEVKRYVDDPFCGFVLRAGSLCDLFAGARRAARPAAFTAIQRGMPVYVFVGSDDPVHAEEKNLQRLYGRFDAAGIGPVSKRVYKSGRHEMLNEVNRGEVVDDVVKWLESLR